MGTERPVARREIPIACSLDASQQAERQGEFRAVMEAALIDRRIDDRGAVVRFRASPGVEDAIRDLSTQEHECCPFLDFDIASQDDVVVLRVIAPAEARSVVQALLGG